MDYEFKGYSDNSSKMACNLLSNDIEYKGVLNRQMRLSLIDEVKKRRFFIHPKPYTKEERIL
jgi:hypothetical protein